MAMDLATFVAETLISISEGVRVAQQKLTERKEEGPIGAINPTFSSSHISPENIVTVDFDVAVTAEAKRQGESDDARRGTIEVLSALIGAKFESSSATMAVSRIKFSVPMIAPYQRVSGVGMAPNRFAYTDQQRPR